MKIDSWAFTNDSKLLATSDHGGNLKIWDIENAEVIHGSREDGQGRIWCVRSFGVEMPSLL